MVIVKQEKVSGPKCTGASGIDKKWRSMAGERTQWLEVSENIMAIWVYYCSNLFSNYSLVSFSDNYSSIHPGFLCIWKWGHQQPLAVMEHDGTDEPVEVAKKKHGKARLINISQVFAPEFANLVDLTQKCWGVWCIYVSSI